MFKYRLRQTPTGRWSIVNGFTGLRVATFVDKERAVARMRELELAWREEYN